MAVDFIDELYREADAIFSLKKMVKYSHCQQHRLLLNLWEAKMEQMAAFCRKTTEWDGQLGVHIWDELSKARDYIAEKDMLKVADTIETLIPDLYSAMNLRGEIDVSEGDYRLFSSRSGFLCIENTSTGHRAVSSIDPAMEAYEKAAAIYNPGKEAFCTLGCELGYLAWQMFEVSGGSIDIYIYEDNEQRIEYARNYGVLDWIPEERLHIEVNRDVKQLVRKVIKKHVTREKEDKTAFYVEDEMYKDLSGQDRDVAVRLLQNLGTALNFYDVIEQNFYRNFHKVGQFVSDIDKSGFKDEWVVVGGGPSVDYNLEYLRSCIGQRTIIAATTVVKRLLNENIKPDYIMAVDMQERTFRHLEGIEDAGIPLIMSDVANWKFGALYKGKKYLVPTEGMFFSEPVYKAAGIELWRAHGTVTAAAIEVAVKLGAKTVELVGVDLAYPGHKSHVSGAIDEHTLNTDGLIKVPSVDGTMVETDMTMMAYLEEIESIIVTSPKTQFFNRSKNGAQIKGTTGK